MNLNFVFLCVTCFSVLSVHVAVGHDGCRGDDSGDGPTDTDTVFEIQKLEQERQSLEGRLNVIEARLESLKRPISLTSFALLRAYKVNTTAADKTYCGRNVRIEAKLFHVDEEMKTVQLDPCQNAKEQVKPTPSAAALLFIGVALHKIECRMESEEQFARAAVIGSGQLVVVEGICHGARSGVEPTRTLLEKCRITQPR